jgi:hypothetical protein
MSNIPTTQSDKPAWVQLYEARRVSMDVKVRTPGRPPANIPRHKVGVTLSQGEMVELETWQKRFSDMLRRKVSAGETVGILTRICTQRLARLPERTGESLLDLVERMVE